MNVNEGDPPKPGDRRRWGGVLAARPRCTPTTSHLSQSSNDTFPTAFHMAVAVEIDQGPDPAIGALIEAACGRRKGPLPGDQGGRTISRTRFPLSLGQEFLPGLPGPAGARAWRPVQLVACQAAGAGDRRHGGWATGLNAPAASVRRWRAAGASAWGSLWQLLRDTNSRPLAGHERAVTHGRHFTVLPARSWKMPRHPVGVVSRPVAAAFGDWCCRRTTGHSSIMRGKVNPPMQSLTWWHSGDGQTTQRCNFAASQGNFELNRLSSPCWPTTCWRAAPALRACNGFRRFCIEGLCGQHAAFETAS